jgi:hypothetical protein
MTKLSSELYMIVKSRMMTMAPPDVYVKVLKTKEEALAYMKAYGLNSVMRLYRVSSKSAITLEELQVEFDPQVIKSYELQIEEKKNDN